MVDTYPENHLRSPGQYTEIRSRSRRDERDEREDGADFLVSAAACGGGGSRDEPLPRLARQEDDRERGIMMANEFLYWIFFYYCIAKTIL